jgi:murein DD-endopeptidase MepM/ murein hydrolase activator NlpD
VIESHVKFLLKRNLIRYIHLHWLVDMFLYFLVSFKIMEKIEKLSNIQSVKIKFYKIAGRWLVFLTALAIAFFEYKAMVIRKAENIVNSVPIVEMIKYEQGTLLNDIYARAQFLNSRVKGVNFLIYDIKSKDNLWKLAKRNKYSVHTLIGVNPQFKTYNVSVHQKILVPSSGGTLHPIQEDSNWEQIAKRYDVDIGTLKSTNPGITELKFGEYLFVPGKKPSIDLLNKEMQKAYELRSLFISPVGGRLTSLFGKRRHPVTGKTSIHGGIDIAVPTGTWIGAAASGTVILASNQAGHYGTAVFIDHRNGYITHYGHLSSIRVRVGQKVRAGQFVGKSGATGRVTGPHLHFTIKKNNKFLDPLKFLW